MSIDPDKIRLDIDRRAREEVLTFARLLADEIARTPMRADGNMNARDLWHSFNDSIKRYEAGEKA